MINKALNFLKDQLKNALNVPGQPDQVLLTSLVNEKGEMNIQSGIIAMTLVNIDEEKIMKTQLPRERRADDQVQFANPDIKLNLLLMLAANPGTDNYLTALDQLSKAITFFQGTCWFDNIQFPALAPEIEELTVELYSISLEQQNQLWASIGAKYIPSVIYKIRLVVIDKGLFGQNTPLIKSIDNNLHRIN